MVLITKNIPLQNRFYIENVNGVYNCFQLSNGNLIIANSNLDTVWTYLLTIIGTGSAPTLTNTIIEFGIGSFTSTTGLPCKRGNVKILGQGKGLTHFYLSASAGDTVALLSCVETIAVTGTGTGNLTGNVAVGAVSIPVTAGSGYAANDYILIRENTSIDTEIANRFKAELHKVQSVSANNLIIGTSGSWGGSIYQAFTTAASACVDKLTSQFYQNFTIEGISFHDLATSRTNSTISGQIDLRFLDNLTVKDCDFTDMFYAGLRILQCMNWTVENCNFKNIKDTTPSTPAWYGVEVRGASCFGKIINCTFSNMRHGVTMGASGAGGGFATTLAGNFHDIIVTGCTGYDTTVAHFDAHQGGFNISFVGNTCQGDDSSANGIQSRCPCVISGNNISGILGQGISLDSGVSSGTQNIGASTSTVIGNKINGCTSGIVIQNGVTEVAILDNTITGTGSGYPINFTASGSAYGGTGSKISGNYILNNTTTTYGILIDSSSDVSITDNFIEASTAVRILATVVTGARVIVRNNHCKGLGATPFQNFVVSNTHIIEGNYGYNLQGLGGTSISTPWGNTPFEVWGHAGANANPTSAQAYTVRGSPLYFIYSVVGGTTALEINGVVVANVVGTYRLLPSDTIKFTWTTTAPTVAVKRA